MTTRNWRPGRKTVLIASAVAIVSVSMLGWAVVIDWEPRAWSALIPETSAWMLALGESSFITLCAVGFFWMKQALLTDARGILSDYGVEFDPREMPPPYVASQLLLFAVLGALLSTSTIFWDPFQGALRREGGPANPFLLYVYLQNMLAWTLASVAAAAEVYRTRALGEQIRRSVRPDLLEPVSSRALLRRGYRVAVMCFLLVGALSMLWSQGVLNPLGGPIALLTSIFLVTVNLVYPSLVLRSLTRDAKRTELARIATEIRAERDKITRHDDADAKDAHLTNLVSYRQMITETSEWPLDVVQFSRVAIAITLAFSSWFGETLIKAFLERLVWK